MKKKFFVVALTGGIGSGKTLASKYFSDFKIPVINSDLIALEIAEKNNLIKRKIISAFGLNSYKLGSYNKKYISEIVFSDKLELEKLNKILHPPTIEFIKNKIKKYSHDSFPYCIVETALVDNVNLKKHVDFIAVIKSTKQNKINRLLEKRNLSMKEIKKRIKSQLTEKEFIKNADFVIENNASSFELSDSIHSLHKIFLSLSR